MNPDEGPPMIAFTGIENYEELKYLLGIEQAAEQRLERVIERIKMNAVPGFLVTHDHRKKTITLRRDDDNPVVAMLRKVKSK